MILHYARSCTVENVYFFSLSRNIAILISLRRCPLIKTAFTIHKYGCNVEMQEEKKKKTPWIGRGRSVGIVVIIVVDATNVGPSS